MGCCMGYPLSILDFSNVNMADAHVTATRRSKVPTRSVPTGYTVIGVACENVPLDG